jgi:hypothetical protein
MLNRLAFVGEEAPADMKKLYLGKRVPDEYRKQGAANPIKYTWGKKSVAAGVWPHEPQSARPGLSAAFAG